MGAVKERLQEMIEAVYPGRLTTQQKVMERVCSSGELPTPDQMEQTIARHHFNTIEAIRLAAVTSPDLIQDGDRRLKPLVALDRAVCEAIVAALPNNYECLSVLHEGRAHPFLKNVYTGEIVDEAGGDYETTPNYGQGEGVVLGEPSEVAKELLKRALPWYGKNLDEEGDGPLPTQCKKG